MTKPLNTPPALQPYTAGTQPVPMLAVYVKTNWILVSYLHMEPVIKKAQQVVATFGDIEVRMQIMNGVDWSVEELRKDFQEHRISILPHGEDKGLSITVVRLIPSPDGGPPSEEPIL